MHSVAQGELDLGELESQDEKAQQQKVTDEHKGLVERIKKTLGDRIQDARLTHRLTTSPACLVTESHAMSANLERILKSVGQEVPAAKPILEINAGHPLLARVSAETDSARFDDWAHLLFDQALLSEGGQLDDPAAFVQRMNQLLLHPAGAQSTGSDQAAKK